MHFAFVDDAMPGVVIAFIAVIATIVLGGILLVVGKGLIEWSSNNAQPVLCVPARIVARRTNLSVRSQHHDDHHHHAHTASSTRYYATFELEDGKRLEFELSDGEAGLLLEGDQGELAYQGTRYHGFARRLPDGRMAGQKPTESPEASVPLSGAVCVRCEKPLHLGRNDCPACGWTQPS